MSSDKVAEVQGKLSDIHTVMIDSIRIKRSEDLERVDERAHAVMIHSETFKKNAHSVKTQMWWNSCPGGLYRGCTWSV